MHCQDHTGTLLLLLTLHAHIEVYLHVFKQLQVVLFRRNASLALLPDVAPFADTVTYFPASKFATKTSTTTSTSSSPSTVDDPIAVRELAGFDALVHFLRTSKIDVAFSFFMGGSDDLVFGVISCRPRCYCHE
jgi:hypothetical protein